MTSRAELTRQIDDAGRPRAMGDEYGRSAYQFGRWALQRPSL